MKNVDECRNASTPASRSLVWRENGRFFKLESKENQDGRFLLCSAKDVEGKKHRLFFPEGRGFVNGWALLAEKFRGLGLKRQEEIPLGLIKAVPTKEEEKERNGPSKVKDPVGGLPAEKARGEEKCKVDNAVWVDVGDCGFGKELGLLQWCLIRKWKTKAEPILEENMFEAWVREVWGLNEGLRVVPLNEDLLFMEFESSVEAKRVLESGRRNFRGGVLQLERWNPYSGCIRRKGSAQEEWVRVVGLPLHLWKTEVLKKIGDACGGFLAIDKITELRREMKWARILVKTTGSPRPSTVNILEGPRSFELQIWWEVCPWVTDVYPVYARVAAKSPKEEDDGEVRAEKRVGIDYPSYNDDRQREMAGQPDTGGQTGPVEANWGKVRAAHLMKRRGGDQGDWVREKVGTNGVGGGPVQRVAFGPIDRAGFRNGLKWPQLFGPKSGPKRRIKTQHATGGIKLRKEGQQTGVHNKACLGRGGPALIGPNQSENGKSPKVQKQKQRDPGRQKWGSANSLGPEKHIIYSDGETKCEEEGDRPGVKGSSHSDVLVDPTWICARGLLLDAHEERTGLKDCYSFECCEKVGLWEMSSERPFFISPRQGSTENGYPNGQALDIVESGFRGSEVEAAKDFRSRTFGSRYETESSSISFFSPLLCFWPAPSFWGSFWPGELPWG